MERPDAEQVDEVARRVLAGGEPHDEVSLLLLVELRLAAAQLALRLGDPQPFPGPKPDQVRFELGDDGQDVEQESTNRVGRVVHRAAEAEAHRPGGEFLGDRPSVRQRTGQPVQLGDHERVALPAGPQRLPQPWALPVGAGQPVIDIDPVGRHPEALQAEALRGQILLLGRHPGVPDE